MRRQINVANITLLSNSPSIIGALNEGVQHFAPISGCRDPGSRHPFSLFGHQGKCLVPGDWRLCTTRHRITCCNLPLNVMTPRSSAFKGRKIIQEMYAQRSPRSKAIWTCPALQSAATTPQNHFNSSQQVNTGLRYICRDLFRIFEARLIRYYPVNAPKMCIWARTMCESPYGRCNAILDDKRVWDCGKSHTAVSQDGVVISVSRRGRCPWCEALAWAQQATPEQRDHPDPPRRSKK